MTEGNAKTGGAAIRVALPFHLRSLAKIEGAEVLLEVAAPVTVRRILDALEARYPMLAGTIREHGTGKRRAFMRIFACEEDWSHESLDAELPEPVAAGREPLLILGAIAGG
jgi:sulfur-carrier protein